MNYKKQMKFVREKLDDQTLLEQLAEECCELGKAALKAIRAYEYTENVTPVTKEQAHADISEETQDVMAVLEILGLSGVDTSSNPKWDRWARRLGYTDSTDDLVKCKDCMFFSNRDEFGYGKCEYMPTVVCPDDGFCYMAFTPEDDAKEKKWSDANSPM